MPSSEKEAVIEQASRILLRARDPESGELMIRGAWPASLWRGLGTGGPRGGDLYLEPSPGYVLSHWSTVGNVPSKRGANSTGDHGGWPVPARDSGTLLIATQGTPYQRVPLVELPQLLPTLFEILGVEIPPYVEAAPLKRQEPAAGRQAPSACDRQQDARRTISITRPNSAVANSASVW